jgi:hypothetical protein
VTGGRESGHRGGGGKCEEVAFSSLLAETRRKGEGRVVMGKRREREGSKPGSEGSEVGEGGGVADGRREVWAYLECRKGGGGRGGDPGRDMMKHGQAGGGEAGQELWGEGGLGRGGAGEVLKGNVTGEEVGQVSVKDGNVKLGKDGVSNQPRAGEFMLGTRIRASEDGKSGDKGRLAMSDGTGPVGEGDPRH